MQLAFLFRRVGGEKEIPDRCSNVEFHLLHDSILLQSGISFQRGSVVTVTNLQTRKTQ
jgi:hypothetical protein